MTEQSAYARLETRFSRLGTLGEAMAMLHWDSSAMMPAGGAEARGEQLAQLSLMAHELLTDPHVADWLHEAEHGSGGAGLDDWRRANLREMRRAHAHATALPGRLVEALRRACHACEGVWREARPANDWARVRPHLQTVLELTREAGHLKAEALGKTLYDALLDQYEPDGSSAAIERVFGELAETLPHLLSDVLERQARQPAPVMPAGPFPEATQAALAKKLMAAVGFDFRHGRLDTSAHPFTGGVPDDVRLTTRYDESDFVTGMMGVLHETGHALYERGLPHAWRRQPVGDARGMSIHESQSLLIEMQACRSREFVGYLAPLAQAAFGGSGPEWEADNLYRIYTRVEPDFIRVDADEVTYPAHVILRFRLEKALIEDRMTLGDLPGAWAEQLQGLLGIAPPDDRRGCLQDIHWYDGAWGYFPTYTLGAMTAAQLFAKACEVHPEIPSQLGKGDFSTLLAWLRSHVHEQGSRFSSEELLVRATGKPLDPKIFEAHLRRRYLGEE
jgi:carboxypeptidase Taq